LASNGSGLGGTWHYAKPDPDGASGGNGATPETAWNLSWAMNQSNSVLTAGDTVWLLEGTYRGAFTVQKGGQPSQPIVFRQWPGARVVIDRAGGIPGTAQTPSTLTLDAEWVELWDFEVTNSSPQERKDPIATSNGDLVSHWWVPNSVYIKRSHAKVVNLTIHDGGQAIAKEPGAFDIVVSGCIIYNNGWERPNVSGSISKTDGHGLYLRNDGPDALIAADNIVFNQFGYGIHVYTNNGEGFLRNITLSNNVSFNNGTLSQFGTQANLGNLGQPSSENMTIESNRLYFSPSGLNPAAAVNLAYGNTSGASSRNANYIVGGTPRTTEGTGWNIPMIKPG
jgi:hypothetical protein